MTTGHLPLYRRIWNGDDLIGYQPHCPCGWEGEVIYFQGSNELEVLHEVQHLAGGHVMMANTRDRLAESREKTAGL